MPLPPLPTPTGPGPQALAPNPASGQSAASLKPGTLLQKLKLLQEGLNELQQQLSDLVDEVAKSNSTPNP